MAAGNYAAEIVAMAGDLFPTVIVDLDQVDAGILHSLCSAAFQVLHATHANQVTAHLATMINQVDPVSLKNFLRVFITQASGTADASTMSSQNALITLLGTVGNPTLLGFHTILSQIHDPNDAEPPQQPPVDEAEDDNDPEPPVDNPPFHLPDDRDDKDNTNNPEPVNVSNQKKRKKKAIKKSFLFHNAEFSLNAWSDAYKGQHTCFTPKKRRLDKTPTGKVDSLKKTLFPISDESSNCSMES